MDLRKSYQSAYSVPEQRTTKDTKNYASTSTGANFLNLLSYIFFEANKFQPN